MTKEQKMEWLANATNEEVIGQFIRSAKDEVNALRKGIAEQIEAYEDVKLCQAELLKRMEGTK